MKISTLPYSLARRLPRLARDFLPAIAVAWVCAIAISCLSTQYIAVESPEIPGATFVGNEQCSLCHAEEVRRFALTSHGRLAVPATHADGVFGCEACHGPGSLHVENGGGRGVFIVNPGTSPDACFTCHSDKRAEFNLPYHHPLLEGKMNCIDCHDPHGDDIKKPKRLAIAQMNGACAQCHKEPSMPHVFAHEALREGCATCHNVHGSINKKMLVENDITLCLKCHAQAHTAPGSINIGTQNHNTRVSRGACWTAGCHTAVHGSNVDTHLRY